MTIATAAVPPAELAMVSTRSVLEKVFLMADRLSREAFQNICAQGGHIGGYQPI
jgi:hypothetical protein